MTASAPGMGAVGTESRTTNRFGHMAASVRRLRSRTAGGSMDRWLLIVGGVLMPLGVLLILLGWLGASHTPFAFEQTSYLISGGILGLALTIGGGFVYFAYWQTVRIRESRQQAQDVATALGRIEALLTGGALAETAGGKRTGATAARASTGAFVATPNGSIFHRPDCTVVVGRNDLSTVDPAKTKLDPCRICEPLDAA